MRRTLVFAALVACVALVGITNQANAGRVPSSKAASVSSPGARTDITMPYLTNGLTTLGVYQGVAPAIKDRPGLGTKNDADLRPVYNLIYYGAKKAPNSNFTGATEREPNRLRPSK